MGWNPFAPTGPAKTTRRVVVGAVSPFMDNTTVTSKYTIFSFVPVALFGQFRRFANMYFLLIGLLMLFGTTTGYFLPAFNYTTTLWPLAIVVSFSMLQDAFTDLQRHRADDEVNRRRTDVVAPVAKKTEQYKVRTGQIVRVVNGEQIPADLVILATSSETNTCYIDTASIDGETSLKIRRAPQLLDAPDWMREAPPKHEDVLHDHLRGLADGELVIECDLPNERINVFNGMLTLAGHASVPVGKDHVVLRGSSLHSDWLLGVAVYTGEETKLALNARTPPQKLAQLDRLCNRVVLVIFSVQICLAIVTTLFAMAFEDQNFDEMWYVGFWDNKAESRSGYIQQRWDSMDQTRSKLNFGWGFCQYLILYCNFIPLSLYISLEICFRTLINYVNWDVAMYHAETNTPALARSPTVTDLGQVKYIFSDKTGTLTRNEMKLRRVIVHGVVYGLPADAEDEAEAQMDGATDHSDASLPQISELADNAATRGDDFAALLLEGLMLCNTIVVEGGGVGGGPLKYQAESPDEGALVGGGAAGGYVLSARTEHVLCGETPALGGKRRTWEILATNEFDNDRKRMSIFVREQHDGDHDPVRQGVTLVDEGSREAPEGEGAADLRGKVLLLCKGADNAMLQVAAADNVGLGDMTKKLDEFATQGLRTLVFGVKVYTDAEFEQWKSAYYSPAVSAMSGREELLKSAAAACECELTIVGATAIEDKLQVGVPETIQLLADAGIKLWVLTGDKRETAIEIGKACQLLRAGMPVAILSSFATPAQLLATVVALYHVAYPVSANSKPVPPLIAATLDRLEADKDHLEDDVGDCTVWPEAKQNAVGKRGLVVDGEAMLALFGDAGVEAVLFAVLEKCDAVIACRVTPKQKAQLVVLVQTNVHPRPVTLAIGDGANDVNMIMSAQVGVGISGHEGMQAVNASDFAIAQFRFLSRLLLVHGRWGYRRVCLLVLYSFYKNAALAITLFIYCFFSGFSGMSLFVDYFTGLFNFFLFLFIFYVSVLDRDVEAKDVFANPQLYASGRDNLDLTIPLAGRWIMAAGIHGAVVYLIPHVALRYGTGAVHDLGQYVLFSGMLSACLISTVNIKAMIEARTFTTPLSGWGKKRGGMGILASSWFALAFNFAFMFAALITAGMLGDATDFIFPLTAFWDAGRAALAEPTTWLCILFTTATCAMIDVAQRGVEFFFLPGAVQVAVERCRLPEKRDGHARSLSPI
ncbi:hypothetical protein M885DRAFT_590722 [Pelagophyceae sp. CCMP2097]|nr:hypothetical protein M885DRAFT_590722 [Pelagophyceae sp. CCMP2097]